VKHDSQLITKTEIGITTLGNECSIGFDIDFNYSENKCFNILFSHPIQCQVQNEKFLSNIN